MITDPIADVLTRLRNAQRANHENVDVMLNKTTESLLAILKTEGFIEGYSAFQKGPAKMAKVELKYFKNKPVIQGVERVSKPGRRVYAKWEEIRPTLNNLGLSIFSTPKGILSDKDAKYNHVGGEFLCKVW